MSPIPPHRHRTLRPPWSPPGYETSIVVKTDRFWIYRPDSLLWQPPFFVDRAGFVCWSGAQHWEYHNANMFGIEYVESGDALFINNGREQVVGPGSAYIIPKKGHQRFGPGPSGFLHKRYIYLMGPMLDMLVQSLGLDGCDVVHLQDRQRFAGIFKRICHGLALPGESVEKTRTLANLATELLTELSTSAATSALPPQVRKAIAFMTSNMNRSITLPQIAAHCGADLFHLTRLFATSTNRSPMKYLADRRMAWARQILRDTTLSIKEIAVMLGEKDPFYFSTCFRRHFGVSPREYRKNHPG